jgi:hypothetical protein
MCLNLVFRKFQGLLHSKRNIIKLEKSLIMMEPLITIYDVREK